MFKFDYTKLANDEELGSTTNSTVYPYRKNPEDHRWVVKHIIARDFNQLLLIMQEVVLGFGCDHPSVMSVRGYHVEPIKPKGYNVYIKMPRMQANLGDLINKHKKEGLEYIPEDYIITCLYKLVEGLEYLHSKRIAHRHIKPRNILVDEEGNVKLSDIGSTLFIAENDVLSSQNTQEGSSILYMAPEIKTIKDQIKMKKKELYKADVWSLGIVIAELCLLKSGIIQPNMSSKESILREIFLNIEARYSKELAEIIKSMLSIDPKERKTIQEIYNAIKEKYGSFLDPVRLIYANKAVIYYV